MTAKSLAHIPALVFWLKETLLSILV